MGLRKLLLIFLVIIILPKRNDGVGTVDDDSDDPCGIAVNSSDPDCKNWDGVFSVQALHFELQLAVRFRVCPMYNTCFKEFRISLYSLPPNADCFDGTNIITSQLFENNVSGNTFKFNVPKPGPYCFKVQPECHSSMDVRLCSVRTSGVEHLNDTSHSSEIPPFVPAGSQKIAYISIGGGILLLIVVLIGATLVWRCKISGSKFVVKEDIASIPEGFELLSGSQPKETRDIFVLNLSCIKSEARALCKFLCECMKYNVTCLDDQLDMLIVKDESYVSDLINYECPRNRIAACCDIPSDKKIIILESEEAVDRHMHKQFMKEVKNIDQRLDDYFHLCIFRLTSDQEKYLNDYCHIFVVRFNELAPGDEIIKELVPQKRYILPQHLVQLCLELNDTSLKPFEEEYFSRKLISTWEQKPSYKELMEFLA